MSEYDEEDIYIIPHNYQDNGKILGIIDKSSFIVGIVYLLIWLFIFKVLPFDRFTTIILYAALAGFPAIIIFIGIGHDTVIDYARNYLRFSKVNQVYKYEKDEPLS